MTSNHAIKAAVGVERKHGGCVTYLGMANDIQALWLREVGLHHVVERLHTLVLKVKVR